MSHVLDELGRIKIALGSGSSGWPFANIITVSATDPNADFTTITAALAVATAGTIILIDGGTYVETLTIGIACTLIGLGENQTIITTAANASVTVDCTAVAGITLRNLTITNTGAGASSVCVSTNDTIIDGCIIRKTSGAATISIGVNVGGGMNYVVIRDCDILVTAGTGKYGVSVSATSIVFIENGRIGGTTNDVLANTTTIFIDPVLVNSLVGGTAGRGQYYTTAGNLITLDSTGLSSGVWLIDESATLKIKESTLAAAIAAAASGDTVKLDTDTYSIAAMQNIGVSVTVEGDGPEATIITNSVNNSACFDITAAVTVIFRNLTIRMTGSGAAITGIFSNDAAAVILDNCVIDISSGSPTDTRGLWIETGTWTIRNGSKIICTVGTSRYGIYNDAGPVTIAIGAGCEVNGATADIYGDQSDSTLTNFGLLINGQVNFAGNYARANIEPVPTEPIMINGHPLVWQRGTSFAAVADGQYTADRFVYSKVGAMVHTVSQSTDVPAIATVGCLLDYSILVDCTTVDASIAAGDFCTIRTALEGYNFLKIAQQQFVVPFWVKATKTGIYCISFRNSGLNRSYVVEYTINTTDTWEYKQVTVAASPSAGTWDYTNGAGIYITWALAAGSTFQTTAGAWQTGNFLATSNQVNACDSTANDFRLIAGDPLPGIYARPIAPNPYGTFANLLIQCQRYFQKSFAYGTVPASSVGSDTGELVYIAHTAGTNANRSPAFPWVVSMRVSPTVITLYNPNAAGAQVRDRTAAADCTATASAVSERGIRVAATGAAGTAVGNLLTVHYTVAAEI